MKGNESPAGPRRAVAARLVGVMYQLSRLAQALALHAGDVSRSRAAVLLIAGLTVVSTASNVVPLMVPYLSEVMIDRAIPSRSFRLFGWLVAAAAVLLVANLALGMVISYLEAISTATFSALLRERLFRNFMDAPMEVQRSGEAGGISVRLTSDVTTFCSAVIGIIPHVIGQISAFIALCVLLGMMKPILLVLMAVSIPAVMVVNAIAGRFSRPVALRYQAMWDRQINIINLATTGYVPLLSYGAGGRVKDLFGEALKGYVDAVKSQWRINAWRSNAEWLFSNGLYVTAMWMAYYFVMRDRLSLGEAVAAIMYFNYFVTPVTRIAESFQIIAMASAAAERLLNQAEFAQAPVASRCAAGEAGAPRDREIAVALEGVSFAYPKSDHPVFTNVSFEVPFGQVVGVYGPSGVGKTTLARIVAGHFAPVKGSIRYAPGLAMDADACSPQSRVLYVPDDIFIIPGTIRSNIRFFSDDDDEEKLQQSLKDAALLEVISALKAGCETAMRGDDADLSKGQKQRVMIARAMYRAPEIAVFDESTNYLDSEAERQVLSAMRRRVERGGSAAVFISHKSSVMDFCDVVYRLAPDGCTIMRRGTVAGTNAEAGRA